MFIEKRLKSEGYDFDSEVFKDENKLLKPRKKHDIVLFQISNQFI